jgi:tetratricopeptide (TPR) repeat protein
MDLKDLINRANTYDDSKWPFSGAKEWENICKINPTPFKLLEFADQLRLSGNLIKAEEITKSIDVKKIPAKYKYRYYVRLGMIYQDQYLIKKAISAFKKSIKIGTEETYPYIFLAVLLSRQNKLDESEQVLIEALNKEGDIDEAYFNLGTIKARQGDFKAAINMLKECLKIDSEYPNAQSFLGDFENMLEKN